MNDLATKLDEALEKSIDRICPNHFHNIRSNHCAHFVSHMTDLQFSFNCKEFKGGVKQPGNVRVHEIFAKCPKVGVFDDDVPTDPPVLVFVTRKANVNLAAKTMGNIPQKHIGIFLDGMVYHYSNTADKVVKWTPRKFFDTFERIYSGTQGLFYGTIPGSDLHLTVDRTAESVDQGIGFELSRHDDREWYARATSGGDQNEFYVGKEILKDSKKFWGIYLNASEYHGSKFDPEDFVTEIDHWAYLLYVTGFCESNNFFNVFNTYDRAKFTYGFYQHAAHTPNDNLILLFRRLLTLDGAKDYFPELSLVDGRLHRVKYDGGFTDLEAAMNTGPNGQKQLQLFMNYLNPFRRAIEDQEVLQVARMMHWTANDPAFRLMQVSIANEILQDKMTKRYDKWYGLDGKSDLICCLIADIHHQGRGSKTRVKAALDSSDPMESLITINPNYKGRIKNLRKVIKELQDWGKLGTKSYDAANSEFV